MCAREAERKLNGGEGKLNRTRAGIVFLAATAPGGAGSKLIAMGIYQRLILPRLTQLVCGMEPMMRQREKVVPRARGRVLEVGLGTGLNLRYYDPATVTAVVGLEPSTDMAALAEQEAASVAFPVEIMLAPAEDIPFEDAAFDTIVMTYTLCSIPDPLAALRQMARVLKPGGRLLFCEHGAAPDAAVRRWQQRLTPLWQRFAGGCRLDRDTPALLAGGGFRIESLETMYLPGWRPATFNYWGSAAPK